jgi:hypothetical protein
MRRGGGGGGGEEEEAAANADRSKEKTCNSIMQIPSYSVPIAFSGCI